MLNLNTTTGLAQYILNEMHKRGLPINRITLSQLVDNINDTISKKTGKTFLTDKKKNKDEFHTINNKIYHRYMEYGLNPIPKSETTNELPRNGIIKNKVDACLNAYFTKRNTNHD